MLLLFDLRGESHEKVKWRHNLFLHSYKVLLSFKIWIRRYRSKMMDYSIFLKIKYATFVWPPRWKSWKRKMTAYHILIFMQSLIKFQSVVPEIQMKRAKRDILWYIHTYLLSYILTYCHRVSYKLTKKGLSFYIYLVLFITYIITYNF